jgi:CheY-like chemotaxis protein
LIGRTSQCYHRVVTDFVSFTQNVHDAFGHLYDRVHLKDHALTRQLYGDGPLAAERLHHALIDSLQWLRPLGGDNPRHAEWRRYRHLQLRYIEGATPDEIARELLISGRQARRDHVEALDELSRLLWERFANTPPPASHPTPTRAPSDLESEISKVLASTGETPTRVDDALRSAVETAHQLAADNRVTIEVALEPELPAVKISRPILRQILLNLLADAIVRHPGTTLELQATKCYPNGAPSRVEVALGLTGSRAISDGLASASAIELTERLARPQNVAIRQESDGPLGANPSTIVLELPATSERTILLVDDNPDVALLFRRFLADTSFHLIQARSAERALRLAREVHPDLVVLDVLLPTTDGWELLQALRADPATDSIPVVISSVVPDHALARSLGVNDFLPKPVTQQALLTTLTRLSQTAAGPLAPGLPATSG